MQTTSDSIAIIPEVAVGFVHQLKEMRCVVWWLSVDNARFTSEDVKYMQGNKNIYHLAQSQYALDWLSESLGINENVYYLSDYINSDFFISKEEDIERNNIVLFNPKKGIQNTIELIMRSDYRIQWQALNGLTPDGMRRVMKQAKVYIDFGNHPGKDRIPREATICGCSLITNKDGAARNEIDVNIPEKYKFDNRSSVDDILETIYSILDNYEKSRNDYKEYIDKITHEFIEFGKDILKFFELVIKSDEDNFEKTAEEYIDAILISINQDDFKKALKLLIKYRISDYKETITIDILETVIRIGLSEFQEAEIAINRGLQKDNCNYELYLYYAQIQLVYGNQSLCKEYCEKAIECSKGSPDEEYIKTHAKINCVFI